MVDYKDDQITVVTPTIPPRVHNGMLHLCMESVRHQTRPPKAVSVSLDTEHVGAGITRQRALDAVRTEWSAFLDDDDTFYPDHLEVLHDLVREHEADFAYSWFDGNNPFPMHRGRQMNLDEPHHTTMTVLVRTEIAHAVGFHPEAPEGSGWREPWEDWQFILGVVELAKKDQAKFIGTDRLTWTYHVHGGNTSGLASRW
jgi:hypothetical protein